MMKERGNKCQEAALAEVVALLDERIRRAEHGKVSKRTVGEIFQQAYRKAEAAKDGYPSGAS
jgi:hypothetical protein